jgi:hypothetical protein
VGYLYFKDLNMKKTNNYNYRLLCLALATLPLSPLTYATTTTVKNIELNGWIGPEDSEVIYSGDINGIEVLITSEKDCDLSNHLTCNDAYARDLSGIFNQAIVTDTATRTDQVGYYNFKVGSANEQTSLAPTTNGPEQKAIYGSISFNNKLWLFGGSSPSKRGDFDYANEIWSSADGKHWNNEQSEARFDRSWVNSATLTEHNGELWFYTRRPNNGCEARIWKTPDGTNWTEVIDDGTLDDCPSVLNLVSFQNSLYAIGQFTNPEKLWSSTDGVTWTVEADVPGVESWKSVSATTQDTDADGEADRLWLLGYDDEAANAQLLYTDDLVSWTAIAQEDIGISNIGTITTFKDKLIITSSDGNTVDFYTSDNGFDWALTSPEGAVSYRVGGSLVEHNESFFFMGGVTNNYPDEGDAFEFAQDFILKTADLNTWINNYDEVELFPAGIGMASYSSPINSRDIYVVGGMTLNALNDGSVWQTEDMITWSRTPQDANSQFTPRAFHQVSSMFPDYIMTGGVDLEAGAPVVLRSSVGNEHIWTADLNTNLTGAAFHQMISLQGRLLIIGGFLQTANGEPESGILESFDGSNWTVVDSDHSFKNLRGHQVIRFDGKIWVLGGITDDDSTGIWSSVDGVSWVEETNEPGFGSLAFFSVTELNGTLVITGGTTRDDETTNDTWTSADGINWVNSHQPLPQSLAAHLSLELSPALFSTSNEHAVYVVGGGDFESGSLFQGIVRNAEETAPSTLSVWRQFGISDVTLEVVSHTVLVTDTADGSIITERTVFDSDSVTLYLEGDTAIQEISSTCGGELEGLAFLIDQVTEDCSVQVTYAPEAYEVTATTTGNGSITPASSIVQANSTINLTVTPNSWWYVIDSVEGCGGSLTGANTFTTAPVTSDCSVTATFAPWWSTWFR